MAHDGAVTTMQQGPVPVPVHGGVDRVDGRPVQVLTTAPDDATAPDVVLLPGLGIPQYLVPLVRTLADRGLTSTILDLPGLGGPGPRASGPSVSEVAQVAAAWLRNRCAAAPRPVLLVGHSTGAQSALAAAVQLPDDGPVASLVLAGPTVAPEQRNLLRLVAAAPTAYRRDSPKQLFALQELAQRAPDVLRMLASGIRDTPEETIGRLRLPVVLTAGRADTFAPSSWLAALAAAAVQAPSARVVRLPGSHNNPYTHAVPFGGLLAVARAAAAR